MMRHADNTGKLYRCQQGRALITAPFYQKNILSFTEKFFRSRRRPAFLIHFLIPFHEGFANSAHPAMHKFSPE